MEKLKLMGFSENASRRATRAKNNNSEEALDWLLSNDKELDDSPADSRLNSAAAAVDSTATSSGLYDFQQDTNVRTGNRPDAKLVSELMLMGFSENASIRGCVASGNNMQAAANWLFNHAEDADVNARARACSNPNNKAINLWCVSLVRRLTPSRMGHNFGLIHP